MFQRRISSRFGPWTLAPRARAALFEYMQFVRVIENITFCSLFTNRLRPFCYFNHHTVTSNSHPFLFSSETWGVVLKVSQSVLRACNEFCSSFSYSFKYFHAADTSAALVHTSIWSCHVIVRYNLFGLLTYSAEHWNSFFVFVLLFWVGEHSVHPYSLVAYFCYLNVCNTEIMMCGWKDCLCCSFWTSSSMNADVNVFNTCFTS